MTTPGILIINPACDYPSYHTAEAFPRLGGLAWTQVADLTSVTVAALVPQGWSVRVIDECISPVDFDAEADFVAITGKVSQRSRMYELAKAFRARGRTVLIGGSFASLNPDDVRPHADILVTGELEELAPRLFADLAAGTWSDRYDGGRADIRLTPVPRWDLYPVDQALMGALQTSRGCPFQCEFCDVIQYQGRVQRHKTVPQVLRELDELHRVGFRHVYLVDDNFTVHRRRTHELLAAIAAWNRDRPEPIHFQTQVSLDVARDENLLAACAEAGVDMFFMGIETINEDSLREAGKRQNLLQPVHEAIRTTLGHGIAVQAGIILGFDHDGPEIFDEMLDFMQSSAIPDLAIGALVAPYGTPLHSRLAAEGRLKGEVWDGAANGPMSTNVIPRRMSQEDLLDGVLRLCRTVYAPARFEKRMLDFIAAFGVQPSAPRQSQSPPNHRKVFQLVLKQLAALGEAEAAMIGTVLRAVARKPQTLTAVTGFLSRYLQFRYFLAGGMAAGTAQANP